MEPLLNAKELELYWVQPVGLTRNFILQAEERVFAVLDFSSIFSSVAVAKSGVEQWTFRRGGFFSTSVIIRKAASEIDLATYRPKWTGTEGQVEFAYGLMYRWKVANFWATRYFISDKDGSELITYQSGSKERKLTDLFKHQAKVTIALQAWQIKELPLLVMLGWYLVILFQQDSGSAATTASISALY